MQKTKRVQEKLEKALETMLSEHVSCFLLVGYSIDGREVTCRMVENDKDRDALLISVSNLADELNEAYYGAGVNSQVEDDD